MYLPPWVLTPAFETEDAESFGYGVCVQLHLDWLALLAWNIIDFP